jgi:hypothetical protein
MEYWERSGPGLFEEPINASTNAVFLVAAWAAWLLARRKRRLSPGTWILIGLAASIGIGSGLWHTFATPWAEALDRIPILMFQLVFLWLYVRGIIAMSRHFTVAFIAAFIVVGYLATLLPPILNRSLIYAPAFLVLVVLGVYHYQQRKHERFILIASAGVFFFALVFRSIDLIVGPYFSVGTHFLWHMLNGLNVYLAMRCLILNLPHPIAL